MPFRIEDWEIVDLRLYQRAVHSQNPFELKRLSTSLDRFVRARVAGNQYTDTYTHEHLIRDPFPAVVAALPVNPSIDPVLVTLIEMTIPWRNEAHYLLRSSLMSSPYTSRETIEELYRGGGIEMQLGRVNRPDCPTAILEEHARISYEKTPRSTIDMMAQIMRWKARAKLGLPILEEDEPEGY